MQDEFKSQMYVYGEETLRIAELPSKIEVCGRSKRETVRDAKGKSWV